MYERFGYKNAEHAARDRLHDLEQRNMSFAQYVNAFDDCYAHIPHYDEADKVHRFLRGLRPGLRNKLCINPATAKRWTRYIAMVAYGHNLMNESNVSGPPADIIADVSATAARNPKRPAPPAAGRLLAAPRSPRLAQPSPPLLVPGAALCPAALSSPWSGVTALASPL